MNTIVSYKIFMKKELVMVIFIFVREVISRKQVNDIVVKKICTPHWSYPYEKWFNSSETFCFKFS